ncbi:transcriptional repressor AgaR [Membranihabitans maritimus]|uniref:transcriptional repressor AgaR n=1 Tax=Membranihabitans maritimus TaxID=2904244 RepID=UPI001F3BE159|nr:transcriptional repressor AgaR [Membranihabitans maritimus]
MSTRENKSTVSRRIAILDKLNKEGQVSVSELSELFDVSEVTIRNDLAQLEKKNMLLRARGGAMKVKQSYVGFDYPLSDKQKQNLQEKIDIGKKSSELIEEGNTIILDSGSTTFEVAKNFDGYNDLTVITNALNIATYLAKSKTNVIVPGGTLRKNSLSLVGILAEKGFRNYFCDKLFLGVDGFDINHGISTPSIEEAHLNQIMIEISKEVIVVCDSSKFERRGFAFIAPMSKIDIVVTDKNISEDAKSKLEGAGVKVIIA